MIFALTSRWLFYSIPPFCFIVFFCKIHLTCRVCMCGFVLWVRCLNVYAGEPSIIHFVNYSKSFLFATIKQRKLQFGWLKDDTSKVDDQPNLTLQQRIVSRIDSVHCDFLLRIQSLEPSVTNAYLMLRSRIQIALWISVVAFVSRMRLDDFSSNTSSSKQTIQQPPK